MKFLFDVNFRLPEAVSGIFYGIVGNIVENFLG